MALFVATAVIDLRFIREPGNLENVHVNQSIYENVFEVRVRLVGLEKWDTQRYDHEVRTRLVDLVGVVAGPFGRAALSAHVSLMGLLCTLRMCACTAGLIILGCLNVSALWPH